MADDSYQQPVSKPLNPMASPYTKLMFPLPNNPFYFRKFPPSSSTYYFLPSPVLIRSPFYTYNVHLQPLHRKPLSPPTAEFQKKIDFSLTPVSSGPRIPKFRSSVRCRRVKNVSRRSANGNEEMKWRPKNGNVKTDLVGKKKVVECKQRWKNKSGEYQKNLPLESETTTVMIRNIPNKYTRKLLIQTLDNHCKIENSKNKDDAVSVAVSAYDFLYLPIDFNHRANAGFAFVNFTSPEAALRFRDAFHGKRWDFFDSPKIAEISKARIQGKEALINHCKVMNFAYGSEEDLPVWFDPARDGSGRVASKMRKVGKFHRYWA